MEKFFVGSAKHKLDGKGRISLPAQFREVLAANGSEKQFVIIPALPGRQYHLAMSVTAHNALIDRLDDREDWQSEEEEEETRGLWIANARRVSIEDGGRFVLSRELRDALGLSDEVLFFGDAATFRIYDPATQERIQAGRTQARVTPARVNLRKLV